MNAAPGWMFLNNYEVADNGLRVVPQIWYHLFNRSNVHRLVQMCKWLLWTVTERWRSQNFVYAYNMAMHNLLAAIKEEGARKLDTSLSAAAKLAAQLDTLPLNQFCVEPFID